MVSIQTYRDITVDLDEPTIRRIELALGLRDADDTTPLPEEALAVYAAGVLAGEVGHTRGVSAAAQDPATPPAA